MTRHPTERSQCGRAQRCDIWPIWSSRQAPCLHDAGAAVSIVHSQANPRIHSSVQESGYCCFCHGAAERVGTGFRLRIPGAVPPVPGGVGKWTVEELVLRLKEMEDTKKKKRYERRSIW